MTEIATGLETLAMNVTKTVVGLVAQTKKKEQGINQICLTIINFNAL